MKYILKLKSLILMLFVFSIPFQYWDPFGIKHFFTISKFIGFLYFTLAVLNYKQSFSIKYVKRPLCALFSLWIILLIQSIFNYWPSGLKSIYNFTFFQNIVLFWIICNDIISNKNNIRNVFISLILGVVLMTVLASLGIGLDTYMDDELGGMRLRFFGSNPNDLGDYIAFSLIFIFGMVLYKSKYFGLKTYLLLLGVPNILYFLSLTGSRGALLIAFIGIVVVFLFYKTKISRKIVIILSGIVFLSFFITSVTDNKIVQQRIQKTESGDGLGGRLPLWKNAFNIFADKPILGKGVSGLEKDTTIFLGSYMQPHNIFLYILASAGLIGFILFCIFLYNLYKSSLNHARANKDLLLFALFIPYLVVISKSGGSIDNKFYWLIAAIIFATSISYSLKRNQIKRN